jgi:hypothetical protein
MTGRDRFRHLRERSAVAAEGSGAALEGSTAGKSTRNGRGMLREGDGVSRGRRGVFRDACGALPRLRERSATDVERSVAIDDFLFRYHLDAALAVVPLYGHPIGDGFAE